MRSEREISAVGQMRSDLEWLLHTAGDVSWASSKSDLVEFVHLATFGPPTRLRDATGRTIPFKDLLAMARRKVGIAHMGKASAFLRQRQLRKQPECAFMNRYIYVADTRHLPRPLTAFLHKGRAAPPHP